MNFLYIRKLLLEAVCVGILVVVIGSLMGFSLSKFYPRPEMPEECGNYNKFFIMETGCTCLGLPGGTTTRLAIF